MLRYVTWSCVLCLFVACGGDPAQPATSSTQSAATPVHQGPLQTVHLFVGGEKMRFLHNEAVLTILREHGLVIDAVKAGSVEMVRSLDVRGKDALWPSNDIAVEFFRMQGKQAKKSDIIFNSPIVIYTGWSITNALLAAGVVEKRDEGYFIVKFPELLQMITERRQWKEFGLPLYGAITVRCTDPTRSNSGNMFAGLVGNIFAGEVLDEPQLPEVLPKLKSFFAQLGMMEHSSGDIFKKFIATGINNSMVVGYENQLAEFILENPRHKQAITDSVCILYPLPTVWSSHPVIALTDTGTQLIEALKDERLQELAWKEHGFRSGLMGVTQDVGLLGIPMLASRIDAIMPLPTATAMDAIVRRLEETD